MRTGLYVPSFALPAGGGRHPPLNKTSWRSWIKGLKVELRPVLCWGRGYGVYEGTNPKTTPQPPCISYANVHSYYGPYTYCSLDKGVACAQHIQLPTHTCAGHMC